MTLTQLLTENIQKAVQTLFEVSIEKVEFQATRKEFEGDITVVIFPLLKQTKSNPVELGNKIGNYLVENLPEISRFNVVSGFLNIVISDTYYGNLFNVIKNTENYGTVKPNPDEKAVMVEYSSPNTNKPLHLGHVRNNLLGYAVAEILKASGKKVYKTQVINDRGIHICKSMIAWQKYGEGATPTSTGKKGDKLVGDFYVAFDKEYKSQLNDLKAKYREELQKLVEDNLKTGEWNVSAENSELIKISDDSLRNFIKENITTQIDFESLTKYVYFTSDFALSTSDLKNKNEVLQLRRDFVNAIHNYLNDESVDTENLPIPSQKSISAYEKEHEKYVPIFKEAKQMLVDWEAGKPEVIELWKTMNQWVYDGFAVSYKNLGVNFDSYYYESNTYLLGKDVVEDGISRGVFYRKPDNSVWIDLTEDGLDEKLVLRSDGTSVYMTQDIGTAIQRIKDFPDVGGLVYTVGNEQDYHFKVLFLILEKLGFDWAAHLYHLSYGMVDLPTGKMKSREGTVVDADDLMNDMTETAREISEDLGKLEGYSQEEKLELYTTIGLGALKYYILKVDPKKRILFNPKESIDFAGNTGPFIQYAHARIQSILRKADFSLDQEIVLPELHEKEKEIIKQIELFPGVIQDAAKNHSPALLANYTYDLVREYNSFYQTVSILGEEDEVKKVFRVQISKKVGETIKLAFGLLGITVPNRM